MWPSSLCFSTKFQCNWTNELQHLNLNKKKKTHVVDICQLVINGCKPNEKKQIKLFINITRKCGQVHHVFQQIFNEFGQMNTINLFTFFDDQGLVAIDNENLKNWKSNHTTSNDYCHVSFIIEAMCHSIFEKCEYIYIYVFAHTYTYIYSQTHLRT